MIQSMTGYGKGEFSKSGTTAVVEVRSVNSRFLEVASRLPRSLSMRENEVKEIVRSKVIRGKVSVNVTLETVSNGQLPLRVNNAAARSYYRLLNELRKAVRLKEQVKLQHLLMFSEIFEGGIASDEDSVEWEVFAEALRRSLDRLREMRENEGNEIARDMLGRLADMEAKLGRIETIAAGRVPQERERLTERIEALLGDKNVVDNQRLELEIALLADKFDVTEECVRFKSHTKFFREALSRDEAAGRKLNFLIQEMNREANTIGSKANDAEMAHLVVSIKEELEKIREQLQNIE